MQASPESSYDEMRRIFEQWERITGEPGGADYIEAGVEGPGLMGSTEVLRAGPRVAARAAVVTSPARCICTKKSMPVLQRRLAAAG